jgi:chromosome segregation ATPase
VLKTAEFAKSIMATEEIQFLDDELQNIYSEIRKGIEQLASMQGTADKKLEKYSHLTQRVSRARTAYQSFKVELRELRDEEKKTWSAVSQFIETLHRQITFCNSFRRRKRRSTTKLSPSSTQTSKWLNQIGSARI